MKVLLLPLSVTLLVNINCIEGGQAQNYPNDGRYYPDDEGRYIPDFTGRYYHDSAGNYLHEKYEKRQIKLLSVPPLKSKPNINGKYKIIHQNNDLNLAGYQWEYDTENKIIAEETGKVVSIENEDVVLRVSGFFQYTGPNNIIYSVNYTADENGFVPRGKQLPKP